MATNLLLHARHNFARSKTDEGSTLVETALSMTILLTLVFGIFALCVALYSYAYVSNAAREATRFAIVRGSSQGTDCSSTYTAVANCIALSSTIQTYVKNLGFPGINPNNIAVTTNYLDSSGTVCTPEADSCKAPGHQVQTTVTYSYLLNVPFLPSKALSMSSTSQMIISY